MVKILHFSSFSVAAEKPTQEFEFELEPPYADFEERRALEYEHIPLGNPYYETGQMETEFPGRNYRNTKKNEKPMVGQIEFATWIDPSLQENFLKTSRVNIKRSEELDFSLGESTVTKSYSFMGLFMVSKLSNLMIQYI